MANIHILRPESITPIARYLARSEAATATYGDHLDLALALLYRESEYRVFYLSGLDPDPGPHANSPFRPFDVTSSVAAARWCPMSAAASGESVGVVPGPHDLFGLKGVAAARLVAALRPVASHRMGWVIAAELLNDPCRFDDAGACGERAAQLGAASFGFMLAWQATWDGARRAGIDPAVALKNANAIVSRARRAGVPTDKTGRWATHDVRRELDEWLRRAGVRVRARVEAELFTRFVTTEPKFCEEERRTAMASFDLARVPPGLHHLADLARAIGVGDDACRALFIRRMTAAARREAASHVSAADDAIQAWLDHVPKPHEAEAAAYFWLRAAADDLRGRD